MPKGPKGQRRPADAIACAVMVAQIATGERAPDQSPDTDEAKKKAGALARKTALPAERRSEIAKIAAEARWRGYGSD